MSLASIIVYVYAVLVIVGGVIGFAKARSLPSLLAGILSGLILMAAGWGMGHGTYWGRPLSLLIVAFLLALFAFRFFGKTPRVFMPGGLMAILSLITLLALIFAPSGR